MEERRMRSASPASVRAYDLKVLLGTPCVRAAIESNGSPDGARSQNMDVGLGADRLSHGAAQHGRRIGHLFL